MPTIPRPWPAPPPAAPKAERPGSGWGLTYVLAPGEGQGPVNRPSLLLGGWWLVAVVPGLLGRQHIHFRVGVLIWVFIIAVLQVQIPCSAPHACLGGTEGRESKAGRGRLTRVRQLLAAALGLKPGLLPPKRYHLDCYPGGTHGPLTPRVAEFCVSAKNSQR